VGGWGRVGGGVRVIHTLGIGWGGGVGWGGGARGSHTRGVGWGGGGGEGGCGEVRKEGGETNKF